MDAYDTGLVQVTGHSYVRDPYTGSMVEKTEARTQMLALASGTLIVYRLPGTVAPDALTFTWADGRVRRPTAGGSTWTWGRGTPGRA